MAQAIVGMITLYSSRHFERQLGVKKYAAFVVVSYVLSLLLQIGLVVTLRYIGMENFKPAQGPYFIIFALLSMFYGKCNERYDSIAASYCYFVAHIPKLQSRALILGLEFSEKSWIYLLACQLLLADGSSSIGSSMIGLLIGYLYDRNVLRLQSIRLPVAVERSMSAANNLISSLFPRPAERIPTRPGMTGNARPLLNPNNFSHDQMYGNGMGNWEAMSNDMNQEMMQYGGFGPRVPNSPPSEESIQMLMVSILIECGYLLILTSFR
jgi:hypothetical protein